MNEMEALSFLLMAAGSTFEGLSQYSQAKREAKYLKAQAAERERQARFVGRMSIEDQITSLMEEDISLGAMEAGRAKAGLRLGGSAKRRRTALSTKYGRQRELIRMKSSEQIRQMESEAGWLRKRAKDVKKAGKWGLLTSLLSGGFSAGSGLYKSGFFSDLFGKTSTTGNNYLSSVYTGTVSRTPMGNYPYSINKM